MDNCTFIIPALIVAAIIFVLWLKKSTHAESFTPVDPVLQNLHRTPTTVTEYTLPNPYCANDLGQPVPCRRPCNNLLMTGDPTVVATTCLWDFPVPVFGPYMGAYTPSKWLPGPPL